MNRVWQIRPLGDLCEFQRGLTYSKGDEVDLSNNVVLRAMNIDLGSHLLDLRELKYISDRVVVPESKKVRKGSLLICTSSGSKSHLGKIAYIDSDYGYAFGGFMGMLTASDDLVPRYLFHLMTSGAYEDFIAALAAGMNINNLKSDDLRNFQVPYPPRPEQQRIVSILDEAVAAIATARANTEQNLRNARELFHSRLNAVFTERGEGWVEGVLADIATFTSGLWKGEKPPFVHVGVIRNTNFTKDGLLDDADIALLDVEVDQFAKRRLRPGDIILEKSGGGPKQAVGRVVLFDRTSGDFSLSNFTSAIRIKDPSTLDAKYLHLYLHWLYLSGATESMQSHSTGIRNLNGEAYRAIKVPYPNREEQVRLAGVLGQLFWMTKRLSGLANQKLAALDALKQSLLHQAFTGVL